VVLGTEQRPKKQSKKPYTTSLYSRTWRCEFVGEEWGVKRGSLISPHSLPLVKDHRPQASTSLVTQRTQAENTHISLKATTLVPPQMRLERLERPRWDADIMNKIQ
jgi:hypothetical protein